MPLLVVVAVAALAGRTASAQQPNFPAAPSRIVLGARAVALVADAVYAFKSAPSRIFAVAGTDQGLGSFLGLVDRSFSSKPVLDRTAGAEAYAALKPDLVILKGALRPSLGKNLEQIKIPTLYIDLETPEDYYRDLSALGGIFNEEDRARELIAYYTALTADTERRVAGAERPRTLLVQAGAGTGLWEAPPAAWMQTRLISLAGGDPVWVAAASAFGASSVLGAATGWTRAGAEQIAAWDPQAVIVVSYREDASLGVKRFLEDPRFAAVSAVRGGRVYGMPQDFYSWDQPDTRWILGLRRMGAFLHPDRFGDADPGMELYDFYRTLYGMDRESVRMNILPRLKGDHGVR